MADKRHEALLPLTHDHHHALAHARRLGVAARGADQAELLQEARVFVEFFRTDTIVHFREEEEVVFPLVIDSPDARTLLSKVMLEHLQLHALVGRLEGEITSGSVAAPTAAEVAGALQAHIRLEEKEVFPLIEQMAADELPTVELGHRSRGSS